MKTRNRTILGVGLAALSAIASALPSFALTVAEYGQPHKTVINGVTKVYIPGQTANTDVIIEIQKTPTVRAVTFNNCGWAYITDSTTSPIVNIAGMNGSAIDYDGQPPTQTPPTCVRNATTGMYESSSTASVGAAFKSNVDSKIWMKGSTGPGGATVQITAKSLKKAKANNCGIAAYTVSATSPFSGFVFNTTSYSVSNLPDGGMGAYCRKVGTSYALYVPAS